MTSTPINYARHQVDPETLDAFAEALLALEDPAFMRACQQLVLYAEGNPHADHNKKLLTTWSFEATTRDNPLSRRAVGVMQGLAAFSEAQQGTVADLARYGFVQAKGTAYEARYAPPEKETR